MGMTGRGVIAGLALSSLILAGCASPTPTGRGFEGIQQPPFDKAALYIYAPPTGMPVWGQMSALIFIDGKAAVRLDENYFARFELSPGTYKLHASTDSQIGCGGQLFPGTRYAPVVINASPNQLFVLRYSSHPVVRKAATCDRYLGLIDLDTARDELIGLREAEKTYP
jgi:hypothetical protein